MAGFPLRACGAVVALILLASGCAGGPATPTSSNGGPASGTTPPVPTISMITVPPTPPSGRVDAVITQSSHDRAHGQVQVLLSNGTDHLVRPRRILYADPRLSRPVAATRLRPLPSGGHRGYPVALPPPTCPTPTGTTPTLTMSAPARQELAVTDENDDIGQYVKAACFHRLASHSVRLRLAFDRPRDDQRTAHLVVVSRRVGSTPVRLLSMLGTPLFAPTDDSGAWYPRARLRTGAVRLPVIPARCDPHAFGEGGEMTVFAVTLAVGSRRGSFKLALDTPDKQRIYAYALAHCGLR